MIVAITAASGQLGAAIVRHAVKVLGAGNVIALARTVSRVFAPEGVEIRPGDYKDRKTLTSSLAGADAVLLVSSNAPPEQRLIQHRNVVVAAKAAGVKKIVYTGIAVLGDSPITDVSKYTENLIKASGLDYVIGRNGLYLEPDLEYVETYAKEGFIANCGGSGRCAYTSRNELAAAYTAMITRDELNGGTYNLAAESITQAELTEIINQVFGTALRYRDMSPEAYEADRRAELGDFVGGVIGGIYRSIRNGMADIESDFETVTGRPHKTVLEMARDFAG